MGRWEIRSKSKSRRLDETFLAGSIDGQEGSFVGARAPVLQLYMQPKSWPGTAGSTSGTGSGIGGVQASSSSATLVDTSSFACFVWVKYDELQWPRRISQGQESLNLRQKGSISRSKSCGSLRSQKS